MLSWVPARFNQCSECRGGPPACPAKPKASRAMRKLTWSHDLTPARFASPGRAGGPPYINTVSCRARGMVSTMRSRNHAACLLARPGNQSRSRNQRGTRKLLASARPLSLVPPRRLEVILSKLGCQRQRLLEFRLAGLLELPQQMTTGAMIQHVARGRNQFFPVVPFANRVFHLTE